MGLQAQKLEYKASLFIEIGTESNYQCNSTL